MKTWLTIALGLALLACGTTNQEKEEAKKEVPAKIGLGTLCADINTGVQKAAREISLETEDPEVRRKMILWQLHTMQSCRRAMRVPDPRWAFLDLWTQLYQLKIYAEKGEAAVFLGPQAPIAIDAIERLLERLRLVALSVLAPDQYEETAAAAARWAEEHPIVGEVIAFQPSPSVDRTGAFDALLSVPEGLFSFGGGVKETAQAVDEVAIAAHHAVAAVEDLPQTVRWQVELLLFALDEDPTLKAFSQDVARASDAMVKVGDTVEGLPDRVRETIREVEATQPEVRKTLAEGRGVVEQVHLAVRQVDANLDKLQETFPSVERATANAREAGQAWEGAFAQLNLLANPPRDPDEPPPEPAPPFDIKDAARTAEWATKAAGEVKETVIELRQIIEGQGLDERLAQVEGTTLSTLDKTVERAEDLIDRITWRAAIVIVVFFAALLGYRFAAALVPRREE